MGTFFRAINMVNSLLAAKKGMTQVFEDGIRVPVTRLEVGPCVVTQVKTQEKDGYAALQLGFRTKNLKNTNKPKQGHLKGAIKENKAPRFLAEVVVEADDVFKIGDEIELSEVFAIGDIVTVTGVSKGKGFAGVIKRWGFSGFPETHGHDGKRVPGSISQGTSPGRVRKGKKMPGRMGGDTTTVTNLKVVSIDDKKNEIWVAGSVPGTPESLIIVKRTSVKQIPVLEEKSVVAENIEETEVKNNEAIESTKEENVKN